MELTKSNFLKYRICPSYSWLWNNKRELVHDESTAEVRDNKFEQGNQVEAMAYVAKILSINCRYKTD